MFTFLVKKSGSEILKFCQDPWKFTDFWYWGVVLHSFLLYLSHRRWNSMFPHHFMMSQDRFPCRFFRFLSKFWNFRPKNISNSLYKMWTFSKNFEKSYLSEYLTDSNNFWCSESGMFSSFRKKYWSSNTTGS